LKDEEIDLEMRLTVATGNHHHLMVAVVVAVVVVVVADVHEVELLDQY